MEEFLDNRAEKKDTGKKIEASVPNDATNKTSSTWINKNSHTEGLITSDLIIQLPHPTSIKKYKICQKEKEEENV